MERQFLETLTIYRAKSALQISLNPGLGLIFVSLAPAIPGMENKMPDKNTKKYQWEKRLTVSFNFDGALGVAAATRALMEGKEHLVVDSEGNLPSWYRDPRKAGRDGNAKTVGFYRPKNQSKGSRVCYYLGITENTKDTQRSKIGISLEYADLFKIARVMEEASLTLLGWRKDIEQLRKANGQSGREPVRWESVNPSSAVDRSQLSQQETEVF